jgi:hypothetical protein
LVLAAFEFEWWARMLIGQMARGTPSLGFASSDLTSRGGALIMCVADAHD